MHPTVLPIVVGEAKRMGLDAIRLTRPAGSEWQLGKGRWLYRKSHWRIFRILSKGARERFEAGGIRYPDRVFGLLEHSRVTEEFVSRLLKVLPGGNSELYSHPSLDELRHEYDALVSGRVKRLIGEEGIELIRYQDL
jgi:hypothetical protein